jgi:hypothetical protein
VLSVLLFCSSPYEGSEMYHIISYHLFPKCCQYSHQTYSSNGTADDLDRHSASHKALIGRKSVDLR